MKRGKVYAIFVDSRAAFHKVKRAKLWKAMEERGVRRGLIERVKEIFTKK